MARASVRAVLALAIFMWATTCSEFPRDNPFDPSVPVVSTILGPDTITAQFDTLHFSASNLTASQQDAVRWEPVPWLKQIDSAGTYQAPSATTLEESPKIFEIRARVGSTEMKKTVVARRRATSLRLCSTAPKTIQLDALGVDGTTCLNYLDRRSGLLTPDRYPNLPPISARTLDASVARTGTVSSNGFGSFGAVVTSIANGATAIEFSGGGFADTLAVVVKQLPSQMTLLPRECSGVINIKVGQMVQLSVVGPVLDRNGKPLNEADSRTALASVTFMRLFEFDNVTVTTGGLVTGVKSGGAGYATSSTGLTCAFFVVP